MDALSNLLLGFLVALTPVNLFWCLVGVILGTMVGVLPGLGPAATIAMLLPLTLKMDRTTAIIALAGIFYGARYGGSTTSILLNIPGESSSVVTCLDGYQMARKGRAGAALGISAIASFIAGTVGVVGLMLIAPPLARFALRFAPPEYFALMVLGLAMVVFLAGESMVKALLAMLVGLWIATIGTDLFTAESRFTFGQTKLLGGVDFIAATVGHICDRRSPGELGVRRRRRRFQDRAGAPQSFADAAGLEGLPVCFLNGSVSVSFVGALPGAGATVASFMSYGIEKAVFTPSGKIRHRCHRRRGSARRRQQRGCRRRHSVPLLTLGIPGGNTTAILLGGLIISGATNPGPLLDPRTPRAFLGPGRQHVYRQRFAPGFESAVGSPVRADFALALLRSLSAHPRDFHCRCLQRQQQPI